MTRHDVVVPTAADVHVRAVVPRRARTRNSGRARRENGQKFAPLGGLQTIRRVIR